MEFDDHKTLIKDYCGRHSLDFAKLSNMFISESQKNIAFVLPDPDFDPKTATIDGRPMPLLLWVEKISDKNFGDIIKFREFEHTDEYLRA
jgi:hypothetical protein